MASYPGFEDEDPYRTHVLEDLEGPVGSGGIAGPNDFPSPVSSPKTGGYDLERLRQGWASPGIGSRVSAADLDKFLADNQDFTQGVTRRGGDLFDPTGKFIFDAIGNYSTGDPNQMTRIALDGIGSNGQPRTAKAKSAKAKTSGAGAGRAAAPAANPFLTEVRNLIMSRLGEMSKTPSLDDPVLAAQNASYGRSRDRSAEQERAAMAERAAFTGLNSGGQGSGAFDTELRSILEGAGEDKAAFGADLLGDEQDARRAEILRLMDMALQSGDSQSLAELDAMLRREGLAESGRQFDANLGQRRSEFNADMGYRNRTWDDTFGRLMGRDYEDDYRWRADRLLGGL